MEYRDIWDRVKTGKIIVYCNEGENEVYLLNLKTGENTILAYYLNPEHLWNKPLTAHFDKWSFKSAQPIGQIFPYKTKQSLLDAIAGMKKPIQMNITAFNKYMSYLKIYDDDGNLKKEF